VAELSKQDIQTLIRHTEGVILSRTASKQDVFEAVQNLCIKLSSKQDLMAVASRLKDTSTGRMLAVVTEEQSVLKQLLIAVESLKNRLDKIDTRLAEIELYLDKLKLLNDHINNNTRLRQIPLRGEVTI
jgi:hypothetical protein